MRSGLASIAYSTHLSASLDRAGFTVKELGHTLKAPKIMWEEDLTETDTFSHE